MDMEQAKKTLVADMQASTLGLGQIGTPSLGRDKTWDESGIEEKVERLRRAVRDLRWGIQDARRRARQFEDHQHSALGDVVVPLRSKYDEDGAMGRDPLA